MKDATDYANEIAQEGERRGAGRRSRSPARREIIDADAEREGGVEEGAGAGPQGEGIARRQGHDRGGLQGDRLRAVTRPNRSAASQPDGALAQRRPLAARRATQGARSCCASSTGSRNADRDPHGRGDAAHLRRGRAPLRVAACRSSIAAGLRDPDPPVLGAGAVHLHVRLDGEVRRRLRRAHRHPRRRRRARSTGSPSGCAQGVSSCSACSPARCSPASSARWARSSSGTWRTPTRPRPTSSCRVDRLPRDPARLLPDVLPLPAGGVGASGAPASCRITTTATSRAWTRARRRRRRSSPPKEAAR